MPDSIVPGRPSLRFAYLATRPPSGEELVQGDEVGDSAIITIDPRVMPDASDPSHFWVLVGFRGAFGQHLPSLDLEIHVYPGRLGAPHTVLVEDEVNRALDWPPRFDMARQAWIYDPTDRARYLAGEKYATENIRPPR